MMTPGGAGGATPGSVRDKLGLNTPRGAGGVAMTPGFENQEEEDVDAREALKAGFANLPKFKTPLLRFKKGQGLQETAVLAEGPK